MSKLQFKWPSGTQLSLQATCHGFLVCPAAMGQAAGNPPHDPQIPARAALVGECPVLKVKVDNIEIECLADTGSQVTLFNESLCKELFCEKPVGSKSDVPWLLLRGANGLAIPYTGYVVADFRVADIHKSLTTSPVIEKKSEFCPTM